MFTPQAASHHFFAQCGMMLKGKCPNTALVVFNAQLLSESGALEQLIDVRSSEFVILSRTEAKRLQDPAIIGMMCQEGYEGHGQLASVGA